MSLGSTGPCARVLATTDAGDSSCGICPRVAAAIASVPPTDEAGPDYDFCDAVVGTPRCIARQCTICGPIPGNANHTCPQDGGEATVGDAEAD